MNKHVEVEGGELAIRNSYGDLAIIPKKYKREVEDMIKDGCNDCLDALVSTLPKMSDYAQDGTLITDPPKKDPLDPNKDGSLPSHFKGSDENPIELDEVTVTVEPPEWLKYKNEYKKNNPLDINKYVEDRFNNPIGREAIERIDEKGWRNKLRQEGLKNYENKSLDYASEQLIKNKPQGDLSRVEWLNQMSDKEEELIKRNPKYQSSLWADTKRGLTSLIEQNPLQTFQNILNSSDYTDREKREMLKDYADHPLMSKLGDAAKVLNPLSVPSKMVQSAYKDDYTFGDAIKGKKNNAGITEDIATDPLNLVGLGIWSKLSKTGKFAKLDDAYKSVKGLSKEKALTKLNKELPKLEQIPLDFDIDDVMKNISKTDRKNMTIYKEGDKYFKELNNPESLKRLEEFGKEYDIDLLNAYKQAEERWDYGKSIGKHKNFQVKKTDEAWDGLSTINETVEDKIKRFHLESTYGKDSRQVKDFDLKLRQNNSVNYISDEVELDRYSTVIWHELSHDINKSIIDNSSKLKKEIESIFSREVKLSDIEKAALSTLKDYPRHKKNILESISSKGHLSQRADKEFNYITKPTETWAFLSTNLRQDLKNTGLIKNYNDLLTPEILEQAIKNNNTVYSRFAPYIKDKNKFIKLFNKMTLSIAPMAAYLQSQQNNKTEK
jgi:hypothetical protein